MNRNQSDEGDDAACDYGLLSEQQQQPISPPSQSAAPPQTSMCYHNNRPYKGFSTPFCSLFQTSSSLPTTTATVNSNDSDEHCHYQHSLQTSHLRTDICSLSCFGICQSDQTRYLFTSKRPPSFFTRMTLAIFLPAALFLLAGWCSGHIRNEQLNNITCAILIYGIGCWYVGLCWRGRKERVMVREEILWRLKRREERIVKRRRQQCEEGGQCYDIPYNIASIDTETEYEYYSDDEEEYHRNNYDLTLGQTRFEMNCAHRICGCYPSDNVIVDSSVGLNHGGDFNSSINADGDDGNKSGYILQQAETTTTATPYSNYNNNNNGDLCTRIWKTFTKPCCCGYHFQLCGFCALAQEAREANLIIPRYLRMVDYITMEPFLMYYPRILELRSGGGGNGSFWEHCTALSYLSTLIFQTLAVILVAMLGISLLEAIGYWNLGDMGVLGATFLQAFGVMYIVHWCFHRYDLSVDAVVKYFAAGFVLCTSMAFGVELMEYVIFRLLVMGVVAILGVEQVEESGYGGISMQSTGYQSYANRFLQPTKLNDGDYHARSLAEDADILQGFFDRQPVARIIYIFLTAFLMSGLVEEACKYFGFVMVDHPDFCSEYELSKSKAMISTQLSRSRSIESDEDNVDSSTNGEVPDAIASFEPSMQNRSLSSIRSGVTVAMVAVAVGFTCFENLLHIFVYNRSNLNTEITTLIAKSLFPVHPIAAAIQSIYVCRRDLEKDSSIGLGRIVLPSLLFHGTYDFALMLISDSWKRSQASQYFFSGGVDSRETIMTLCISFAIILCGGLFYVVQSQRQYSRLEQLSRRVSEVQLS